MNKYRSSAAALAACAASLSLAACAAGTTTTSTATTSPAAPSRTSASASASASASRAVASRMIQVSGEVGSFPVPAGAKVGSQETVVIFRMITPAKVSSFYAQALPRAGYTVTANSVITQSGNTVAYIQFTGHGVKGNIDGLSKFTDSTVSVPGLGHKNVTTISLMPK